MFIVVVMDAETQNVETKGMSSLNGQATSTKTGPKSRKRIKMVAKSTNLKDSESLILYSLQMSIDYNIL